MQKDHKLRNLKQELALARQLIRRKKMSGLIESEGIQLVDEDVGDVLTVTKDLDDTVRRLYSEDSPQLIFWEQQKTYNSLKNKRQMRWHPLVLRFALNLKYMSTSAYKAVRQSGVISLPSERTLSDYTHWSSAHSGVQYEFIELFQEKIYQDIPSSNQHQCALSMDEMKIKSGLVFSRRSGNLVGFIDLGSVNRDIERLTE